MCTRDQILIRNCSKHFTLSCYVKPWKSSNLPMVTRRVHHKTGNERSWVWCCTAVVSGFRRWRLEDCHKFQATLDYTGNPRLANVTQQSPIFKKMTGTQILAVPWNTTLLTRGAWLKILKVLFSVDRERVY